MRLTAQNKDKYESFSATVEMGMNNLDMEIADRLVVCLVQAS